MPDLFALIAERDFDAVLFDMDGTLVDSIPATVTAWTQFAAEFGVPVESLQGAHGIPAADTMKRLVPDRHEEATARVDELELANMDGVVALPGAVEALRILGDKAAIVTSAGEQLARARLGAAGLTIPATFVTADDISRGKPDPEPYLLAARHLGADPGRCLVVEDAPAGLASGRAAGCATIAVTTTHDPATLAADAIVADLSEVRFLREGAVIRARRAD